MSNFHTNIRKTMGKKTQQDVYVEKCNLLSETTFLPYFMTGWSVFFYQSVYFLPMVFIMFFITTVYVSMIL